MDSLWNEIEEGNHQYYRVIEDYYTQKTLYKVSDYYKSGAVQMIGFSTVRDELKKEGQFVYYYENGNKQAVSYYKKEMPTGQKFEWYENGNKKLTGEYVINEDDRIYPILKINQYWDKNDVQKVIDGNGDYEENTDNSFAFGKVLNGLKVGEWKGSDIKTKITFTETYNNGILAAGVSKDSMNVLYSYHVISIKPKPRKGLEHFYKYIGKNFRFSKAAENQGGKIILYFIIEKDGSVSDVTVRKSVGFGMDEEAMRLVKNYPDWECGVIRGIKSRFSFTIPISIKKSE